MPSKGVHPTCAVMVKEALMELGGRKGASYQAIKKFVAHNFEFDVEKFGHYIKRSLKQGTENGDIVQVKGQGASGSFKLPSKSKSRDKSKSSPQKKEVVTPSKKTVTTAPKKPKIVAIKVKAPKKNVKASPKPKPKKTKSADVKKEKTAASKKK